MKNKISTNMEKLDIIIFFLTKVLSGILSFVSISIFTYYLNPDIYGEYSLIQGIINVLVSVFIGWMSSASLRYYSEYKENKEKFFTNIFVDYFIVSIIVIIIIVLISIFSVNINIKEYLLFTILLFIFFSLTDLFSSIIRASKETRVYFFIVIGQYIVSICGFLVLALIYKMEVNAIFISYIVAYLMITIFYCLHFKVYKYIRKKEYSLVLQKRFLAYSLPLVGVWATSWLLNYSDRYIIKIFSDTTEVGLYDVAYRLSESSINIIITSISMAMMPHIIDGYKKEGITKANEILKNYLRIFTILIVPAIFGMIGIRNHIYGTLLSQEYSAGADIIIYISISMFFFGVCQLSYKLWQLKEKTINILRLMILSVCINIVLNVIFIPKYGFIVAAITTLFSNIVTFLLTFFSIRKNYNFKYDYINLIRVIICSVIMFIFILGINPKIHSIVQLILEIIVAIVIYLVALLIAKGLEPEKEFIKNLIKERNSKEKRNAKKL